MSTKRGPAAVRTALVEAAAELFAAKGDASVRAVAQRAGVNHGLIHHYLGGKQGLRTAVLDHLASAFDARLELDPDADLRAIATAAVAAIDTDGRYVKILARTLLDDDVPERLQTRFPFVARLQASIDHSASEELRAELGVGLALGFGVSVFGPWICAALGLDTARLRQSRDDALERIFARIEATTPTPETETETERVRP